MTGWERVCAQVGADNGDESFGCDMVDYNSYSMSAHITVTTSPPYPMYESMQLTIPS
jgi:hypothetical protein